MKESAALSRNYMGYILVSYSFCVASFPVDNGGWLFVLRSGRREVGSGDRGGKWE